MPRFYSLRLLSAFLLCVALASAARAQVYPLPTTDPTDTSYVRLFPRTFTTRVFVGEKISTFSIEDKTAGHTLDYRPNNILALGLGVTVRGIGIDFSTRLPFHGTKEEDYGKTYRYDVQAHRYRRKLGLDLYLQRYKGFHLTDRSSVTQVDGPTTYPYLPELHQLRFGVTALHIANGNRYSMRAAVNQQEWQIKSAGSWLFGGSAYTQFIHNGGADILPPHYRYKDVLGGGLVREIQNYSITVNGGYGYTYVFGDTHWFIGAAADVGAGPAYNRMKNAADEWDAAVDVNLTANGRVQAGYNSQKWCVAVYGIAHGDRYGLPVDQSSVTTVQGVVRAVAARRFVSFKLGRKTPKPVE